MSDMSAPSYGMSPADVHPVQIQVPYPQESSRLLALITIPFMIGKFLLLLPVVIVLYALGIVAFVIFVISQWAVLFTGKYPEGMHRFMVGFLRWGLRTQAYMYGLTDKYPPFSLNE